MKKGTPLVRCPCVDSANELAPYRFNTSTLMAAGEFPNNLVLKFLTFLETGSAPFYLPCKSLASEQGELQIVGFLFFSAEWEKRLNRYQDRTMALTRISHQESTAMADMLATAAVAAPFVLFDVPRWIQIWALVTGIVSVLKK